MAQYTGALLTVVVVHSNVSDVILMSNIFLHTAERKAIKSGIIIAAD